MSSIVLVEYSKLALAVLGETKLFKEQLKSLGGKFNGSLTYDGKNQAGWIFPKSKCDELITWIESASPDVKESSTSSPPKRSNGLLSQNGQLTSTGKQFLANEGEKVSSPPKKVSTKRSLAKKYKDIELDKDEFKEVKKKIKRRIRVDDPVHYGNMIPGDKVVFFDGDELRITKIVLSVLKVLNYEQIDGVYDDIIIHNKTNDDVVYEVILEF